MLLNLKNMLNIEYVFRLSQSGGKYFMVFRLMLECACATNLFSTVNLDLVTGVEKAATGNLEQYTFTPFLRFRGLQGSQYCLIKHIL